MQNYINAASFARRILELPDINSERHAETRVKAQKVLQKSEQQGRNDFTIDYDEMNPFRYLHVHSYSVSDKFYFLLYIVFIFIFLLIKFGYKNIFLFI
jgi:hypothetical protein